MYTYDSHLNTDKLKCIFFGDGPVSVKETRDILKCTLILNVFYLRAQSAIFLNILLYIAIFYVLFIPKVL